MTEQTPQNENGEILGKESAMQQSMYLAMFKGNYKSKFAFEVDIHKVQFIANALDDSYRLIGWGTDKDTPIGKLIKREAQPLKLSENSDFSDMFNDQIRKYIHFDKVDVSYTTLNFKDGEIETEMYYVKNGVKQRIHLHQNKHGVVTKKRTK